MARTKGASTSKEEAKSILESSRRPAKKTEKKEIDLAPSGSTLLNLACTDTPFGAYQLGGMVSIPGASSAGKTILALTCLAECSMLERFDDYDFIFDDAEQRLAFDIKYLFGSKVKKRISPPPLGSGGTIQTFESNLLTLQKKEKPFIYVLDSFDSLSSDEELEKEMRKALAMAKSEEAAKKIAGSYGTEKAKIAGQILRMVNDGLKGTGSLLLLIQQRRQKMNAGPFSDPYTTAGGEAPFFYCNHQVWLDKIGQEKDKGRVIGTKTRARLKKNSITGKLREAEFSVFYDYGIDNITSCIDFMLEEGFWKKAGHSINAGKLTGSDKFSKRELVNFIEEEGLEVEVAKMVHDAWMQIEEELKLDRKPKYR